MSRAVLCWLVISLVCLPQPCLCRRKRVKGVKTRARILGKAAPKGRFPYVCSLQRRGSRKHECGAVLIHQQFVATAAHCVDEDYPDSLGSDFLIACGIYEVIDKNPRKTFKAAEKPHLHEWWTGDYHKGYDIAVVKLDRVANLKLPEWNNTKVKVESGQELAALGWGGTADKTTADVLQIADELDYVKKCSVYWKKNRLAPLTLCAGLNAQDTCKGDSGGPLCFVDAPDNDISHGDPSLDVVMGLTSYGAPTCGGESPGVYTSFAEHQEWLNDVILGRPTAFEKKPPKRSPSRKKKVKGGVSSPFPTETSKKPIDEDDEGEEEVEDAVDPSLAGLPEAERPKAMIDALRKDNVASCKLLLNSGLDVATTYTSTGFSDGDLNDPLLHWAARFDAAKCAAVLIDEGADVGAQNDRFATALLHCGKYGSPNVAKVLLANEADPTPRDLYGESPLNLACRDGHLDVVKILLENGAEVSPINTWQITPLHEASWQGHLEIAKELLNAGAELDAADETGKTSLFNACTNGYLDIVEALVKAGADKTIPNNQDILPVNTACANRSCPPSTKAAIQRIAAPYPPGTKEAIQRIGAP